MQSAVYPNVDEQQLKDEGGGILYDASLSVKPGTNWFTRDFWAERNSLAAATAGRGPVLFIREAERHWVLRHYRRGGFVANFLTDAFLWLGATRTRSFREWRLLATLYAEGFPVPRPVAARYERRGFVYRADIMTVEIPAVRTLADQVTGAALGSDTWREIGRTIASLHRRGVQHADLNAHNILLGAANDVHVIDFDRGRIRERGSWEEKVLARLKRSLGKVRRQRMGVCFGDVEWQELLAGYGEERDGVMR